MNNLTLPFHVELIIVSPYFIAVLLWYPAYENFFSILRKKIKKTDAFQADNNHFHQKTYTHSSQNNTNYQQNLQFHHHPRPSMRPSIRPTRS